jgi:hypothetical protein
VRVERKIAASVAVLGSVLLALSGAVPALARSGPSAGLSQVRGARFAPLANKSSTSFGGWVFGASAAKSVTAEFKIPSLKCTSTLSGVEPMVGLITGTTAAGFNVAGLLMACQSGTPAAAASVTVNGSPLPDTTNAVFVGDLMKATVTVSASKVTATVADLTKGHAFTYTKSGTGGTSSEQLIIDDSLVNTNTNKQLPVVNFGTISYSKGAISGKAIGSVKPNQAVNMQTAKGVLQILTGPITGTGKNAFTTTWKHS